MPAKVIMVQGTASSVGKSVLTAALCRIFRQDGYTVAPFKSQNMALNSFVTPEGDEIGRAQAVQAEAVGIAPSVYMNPVLLKPEAASRLQVIVMGKVDPSLRADNYSESAPRLLPVIENALNYLRDRYDIVVIEGAGSTAEVNLRDHEIVNMRIAKMAQSPVLLVGDIDRGGIFASLVGTLDLLPAGERDLVKGLIINKFRGDAALFKSGIDFLESRTAKPVLGLIPYFRDLRIAQEDSVYLDERPESLPEHKLDIAVIHLPHISNYDDFDPLEEAGCHIRYVKEADRLGQPDLIILPGTKSTINDRIFLQSQGLDPAILKLVEAGTPVIGICGGFQILGKWIRDPDHVESDRDEAEGLNLLNVETIFSGAKTTAQVKAVVVAEGNFFQNVQEIEVSGYEIHMGLTVNQEDSFFCQIVESSEGMAGYCDGAVSKNGRVWGTYLHGIFHNSAFMDALLKHLRQNRGLDSQSVQLKAKDAYYDELAQLVRRHLNIPKIYEILG